MLDDRRDIFNLSVALHFDGDVMADYGHQFDSSGMLKKAASGVLGPLWCSRTFVSATHTTEPAGLAGSGFAEEASHRRADLFEHPLLSMVVNCPICFFKIMLKPGFVNNGVP